jgi:hypothetical protein
MSARCVWQLLAQIRSTRMSAFAPPLGVIADVTQTSFEDR